MKHMKQLSLLLLVLFSLSCAGPEGPVGPAGQNGQNGLDGAPGEIGIVFEFSEVDFVAPNYEAYLNYPDNFEGLESDVALVYLLWDVIDDQGTLTDVWRQIPQSLLTANGLLIYNFDFTLVDVRLFLAAEFDLGLLQPIDTDDWVVRVVVVPGNFWAGRTSVDHSDYYAVQEAYGLPELPIVHNKVTRRQ